MQIIGLLLFSMNGLFPYRLDGVLYETATMRSLLDKLV